MFAYAKNSNIAVNLIEKSLASADLVDVDCTC